jgi:hypothetical protein
VLADIRNFRRVGPKLFHGQNRSANRVGASDQKRVGAFPAFKQFLLLNIGLKMLYSVYLPDNTSTLTHK